MNMEALVKLWNEAKEIWLSGGWGMIALALNGVVIFAMGLVVFMRLKKSGVGMSPEKVFARWKKGKKIAGPLGKVLDRAMAEGAGGNTDAAQFVFSEFSMNEMAPFERDLKVMGVSVSTAPLFGLLGTVTGMLATFAALASGSGGEQTMEMIAGGIAEALITTETGLVLGISGLFLQFLLNRGYDSISVKYDQLQALCLESLRGGEVHEAAMQKIRKAA